MPLMSHSGNSTFAFAGRWGLSVVVGAGGGADALQTGAHFDVQPPVFGSYVCPPFSQASSFACKIRRAIVELSAGGGGVTDVVFEADAEAGGGGGGGGLVGEVELIAFPPEAEAVGGGGGALPLAEADAEPAAPALPPLLLPLPLELGHNHHTSNPIRRITSGMIHFQLFLIQSLKRSHRVGAPPPPPPPGPGPGAGGGWAACWAAALAL